MWFRQKNDPSVDVFREYSETACDSFNACRFSIAQMTTEVDANSSSKFMCDFLGQGDDLNAWMQLHEERKALMYDVMKFADYTINKMSIVKERIKNKKEFESFKDCFDGYSSHDASSKAKALQEKSLDLRQKIVEFYQSIQNVRSTTVEKEKIKRILAGVLLVTGACCGIVFIASNPEAIALDNIVLQLGVASILDRAFEKSTVVLEQSLAALPTSSAQKDQFTQNETKRAVDFLRGVETKPISETIHQSIQGVYFSTAPLSAYARKQCEGLIDNILNECEKLSNACKSSLDYLPIEDDNINKNLKKSIGMIVNVAQAFGGKKKGGQQATG